MKKMLLFLTVFIGCSVFSANAADIIVLKDGSMIDAKIMEIYPTEIRYKRADNLNEPMITLSKDRVMSIRHESGAVEIVNAPSSAAPPAAGQASGQTGGTGSSGGQQPAAQVPATQTPVAQTPAVPTPGLQASLQNILNTLPAIKIAGNNLQFQFNGANWTALLNGENFSAGTVEVEETKGGSLLTLRQTHMWPGAVAGKLGGKLASKVPGGSAVAGAALDAAGKAVGPVEASGPAMVLEYKAGPPAKLAYLKNAKPAPASTAQTAPAPVPTPVVQTTPTPAPAVQSASVPAATPALQAEPVPVAPALDGPENIVLADAQWIQYTGAENASVRKNVTVKFSIADEEIDGQVREVLTLITNLPKGSGGRWSLVQLTNETMVQTLQKGSDVRFKVLGDGKRWKFLLGTNETSLDNCHFEIPIKTQNGKVVEIDIPYSKLKQPAWGKKVRFIKSNIKYLEIKRDGDIGGVGPSTIKVFDLVFY